MRMQFKCLFLTSAVFFSGKSFSLTNTFDVLGFAGYTQVSDFNNSGFNQTFGSMTGWNTGAVLLVSLTPGLISPVGGIGGHYMSLTSSTSVDISQSVGVSNATLSNSNTFTSFVPSGHIGLRFRIPFVRIFLFGNGGFGKSDKLVNNYTTAIPGLANTIGIVTYNITNHTFYGATGALLLSVSPFLYFGVSGVYNIHNITTQASTAGATSSTISYNETSGNLVVGLSL